MKRGMLVAVSLMFLLLALQFAVAAENDSANSSITVDDTDTENTQIDKAYECLTTKITERTCSKLSTEEKAFALLSVGKCKSELVQDSDAEKCWPDDDCTIKSTALAVLALNEVGHPTEKAEKWLMDQTDNPSDVEWYLQIENSEETKCSISYSGSTFNNIIIRADKTISSNAGTCLSLAQDNYWLRISSSCYDDSFDINCDKPFATSLLYRRKGSQTIYVSESNHAASSEGTTTEKVNSLCFEQGSSCDYPGSLWATIVLDSFGEDMSALRPYLMTLAEQNTQYIPDAFLFLLTGYPDYRTDLLSLQKTKFWDESGNKFYDTALALYPFQNEEPAEKKASKEWLLEVQGKDGCWDGGNIATNAFLLHSIWPRGGLVDDTSEIDCTDSGYDCMLSKNCNGKVLEGYSCAGVFICCDEPLTLESCATQNGNICNPGESCVGGTNVGASGLGTGQICCVGGTCEETGAKTECELSGGTCRAYSCNDDEDSSLYDCNAGDVCCAKKVPDGKSYWWVWLLAILIILVALGIIFRDKLRMFWFRMKSKFTKKKPGTGASPLVQSFQRMMPTRRMIPRGIPSTMPPAKKFLPKTSNEIDDVLKKLKEMGK